MRKIAYYLQSKKTQWLPYETLRALQLEKARAIIAYAQKNVPYYTDAYNAAGINAEDITTWDDFLKVPILSKPALKHAGKSILATCVKSSRIEKSNTGGSTGVPLALYRDKASDEKLRAIALRAYIENGYTLFQKFAAWRMSMPKRKWFNYLGINREYRVKRDPDFDGQVARLNSLKPETFYSNPSQLHALAVHIKKKGLSVHSPQNIFIDSENILAPQREIIEEVFRCSTRAFYGAREFGYLAWECPAREGYHVNIDHFIVEIIDPATQMPVPPRVSGRVVVTDFTNKAMPLIRYDLEDIASYAPNACSCGRGLPLLASVDGRECEMFELHNGDKFSVPVFLTITLREFPEIERYQVTLKANRTLSVKVAIEEGKTLREDKLREDILKRFIGYTIQFVYGDDFVTTPLGKFQTFLKDADVQS